MFAFELWNWTWEFLLLNDVLLHDNFFLRQSGFLCFTGTDTGYQFYTTITIAFVIICTKFVIIIMLYRYHHHMCQDNDDDDDDDDNGDDGDHIFSQTAGTKCN